MKKQCFIKFRATAQEKAAFDAAVTARGKTMSDAIREYMARVVKRDAKSIAASNADAGVGK